MYEIITFSKDVGTIHTLYTTDSIVNVMLRKLWTPYGFSEHQYMLFRLFTFSLSVKSICCWFLKLPALPASYFPTLRKEFLCNTSFVELSFKSFIALWAEELDTTLRTANWQKKIFWYLFLLKCQIVVFSFCIALNLLFEMFHYSACHFCTYHCLWGDVIHRSLLFTNWCTIELL